VAEGYRKKVHQGNGFEERIPLFHSEKTSWQKPYPERHVFTSSIINFLERQLISAAKACSLFKEPYKELIGR
jgi:hypothetical protein